MTAKSKTRLGEKRLLESLLEKVKSIDRNVDEILDRVTDHFDDLKCQSWHNGRSFGENSYQ